MLVSFSLSSAFLKFCFISWPSRFHYLYQHFNPFPWLWCSVDTGADRPLYSQFTYKYLKRCTVKWFWSELCLKQIQEWFSASKMFKTVQSMIVFWFLALIHRYVQFQTAINTTFHVTANENWAGYEHSLPFRVKAKDPLPFVTFLHTVLLGKEKNLPLPVLHIDMTLIKNYLQPITH